MVSNSRKKIGLTEKGEARYHFKKELNAAFHREYMRPPHSRPSKKEFVLDSSWTILYKKDAPAQIKVAVKDFQRFMAVSMGVSLKAKAVENLKTKSAENLNTIPGHSLAVGLKNEIPLQANLPEKPESHRLECSPKNIKIVGSDSSGAMQGIYYLERIMSLREAPFLSAFSLTRTCLLETRILRSFYSPFYEDELADKKLYYSDHYLSRLSHHGFNGIWIHAILQDISLTKDFPEFGRNSSKRIDKLNALIKRAAKYGIKIYLHFSEPYGLPENHPVFRRLPQIKGQPNMSYYRNPLISKKIYAMCTSTPEVKRFLKNGMKNLFTRAPGLAGVSLITASENHTNCYSHTSYLKRDGLLCPRCKKRKPSEVVAEVITLINQGVKQVDKKARVIAWSWSWGIIEPDPQPEIINNLPEDVILMSDFERGGSKNIFGKRYLIDEYSYSYIGPSPRCKKRARLAKKRGMKFYAKLQICNTHELASVPYLPLPCRLMKKLKRLRSIGGSGFMGCWIMGNYPSLQTEIANEMFWRPGKNTKEILSSFASLYFGKGAGLALAAWSHFDRSFDYYPFNIPILYSGPMNRAPAYPFHLKPTNKPMPPAWLPAKMDGDSLKDWTGNFTLPEFLKCFNALNREWQKGVELMEKATMLAGLDRGNKAKKDRAKKELGIARAILCHFKSTVNVVEFLSRRNQMYAAQIPAEKRRLLNKMIAIARREIPNVKEYRKLMLADSRLGYHSEAEDYLYTPLHLNTKIKQLHRLISHPEE